MWAWKDEKRIVYDPSLPLYESDLYVYKDFIFKAEAAFSYDASVTLNILQTNKMRFSKIFDVRNSIKLSNFCLFRNVAANNIITLSLKGTHPGKLEKKIATLQDCGGKFFVQNFHFCDIEQLRSSKLSMSDLPLYTCSNGLQVHYSLTCDGYDNCLDNSDEVLCFVSQQALAESQQNIFRCSTKPQIVESRMICDGNTDCYDGSDEVCVDCHGSDYLQSFRPNKDISVCFRLNSTCPQNFMISGAIVFSQPPPQLGYTFALNRLEDWVVHHDGCGGFYLTELGNDSDACPETHIR